jgi:arginase
MLSFKIARVFFLITMYSPPIQLLRYVVPVFLYSIPMKLALITAPYDSGHLKKRLGLGAQLLGESASDILSGKGHILRREEIFVASSFATEVTMSFDVIRQIARQVKLAVENSEFPIVFAGNCNAAAMGSISGLPNKPGVIWFDCHGDFNTPETTIGGFLDGMAISIVTGACWTQMSAAVPCFQPVKEQNVILIGARDFDPLEIQRLRSSGVTLVPPSIVKQKGVAEKLKPMSSIYLHVDLDVLDPADVKVNAYSTPGGLLHEELLSTVQLIKRQYIIAALGITAYDPSLDPERKITNVVNSILEIVTGE